jgi:hypothetical protein
MPNRSKTKSSRNELKGKVDFFSLFIAFALLYLLLSWALVLMLGNERKEEVGFLLERRIAEYKQEFSSAEVHFEKMSEVMYREMMVDFPTANLMDQIQVVESSKDKILFTNELNKHMQLAFQRMVPLGMYNVAFYDPFGELMLVVPNKGKGIPPIETNQIDVKTSWFSAGNTFNGFRVLMPVHHNGLQVGCVVFSYPVATFISYMQETTRPNGVVTSC